MAVETQRSAFLACEEHYPGESREQKFRNLLEEVTELGCVLGIPVEDMFATMRITVAKSDDPVMDQACIRKEIGDIALSVSNLAETLGVDAAEAQDEVTALMRKRGIAVALERAERKRAMGL